MTITELAKLKDLDLIARYTPGREVWIASFDGVEIKASGLLMSSFGEGMTPRDAVEDYAAVISNETIVINAYSDDRQELHLGKVGY